MGDSTEGNGLPEIERFLESRSLFAYRLPPAPEGAWEGGPPVPSEVGLDESSGSNSTSHLHSSRQALG